jgi:ankyrin repeat protein
MIKMALLAAVSQCEDVEFIEELLSDENTSREDIENSALAAATRGYSEILKCILDETDISSNFLDQETNVFLLMAASHRGSLETVRVLVNKGADVNFQNNAGQTALYTAAMKGANDVVRFLLDSGANVNIQSNNGNTPMHAAAAYRHIDTIEILWVAGANVKIKNAQGKVPFTIED